MRISKPDPGQKCVNTVFMLIFRSWSPRKWADAPVYGRISAKIV